MNFSSLKSLIQEDTWISNHPDEQVWLDVLLSSSVDEFRERVELIAKNQGKYASRAESYAASNYEITKNNQFYLLTTFNKSNRIVGLEFQVHDGIYGRVYYGVDLKSGKFNVHYSNTNCSISSGDHSVYVAELRHKIINETRWSFSESSKYNLHDFITAYLVSFRFALPDSEKPIDKREGNKTTFDYSTLKPEALKELLKFSLIQSVEEHSSFFKIIYTNGSIETWSKKEKTILRSLPLVNGVLHSETGPAKVLYKIKEGGKCELVNEFFFLNGKSLSKKDWKAATNDGGLTTAVREPTLNESETPIQNKEKEKSTMSKILDTAKKDGREVGKRVAVKKATEAATKGLAALISPGEGKKEASARKSVEEALKTPAGQAVVSFLIGAVVPVVEDKIPEKYRSLANEAGQEARVQGECVLAEMFIDQLGKPAMQAAINGIQGSLDKVIESETMTEVRAELPATKASPNLSEVDVDASKEALKTRNRKD